MSELFIPPWIIPEDEPQGPLDEGSSVFRAAFAPGLAQRQSYGGLRLKLSRRHTVRAEEKALLLAMLRSTRGSYKAVRTKVHFQLRGTFPSTQLLTNNTFANGTTGWTTGSKASLSVSERILRMTRTQGGSAENWLTPTAAATVVAYAPYVSRYFVMRGRGAFSAGFRIDNDTDAVSGTTSLDFGMKSQAFVPFTTSLLQSIQDNENSGILAGDYISVSYAALSRCMLVDNAANDLEQARAFDQSPWVASSGATGATISANSSTAPDGTATADGLNENTANTSHYVYQPFTMSSAVQDRAIWCCVKAAGRNFVRLRMNESTGGTVVEQWFNLGTGAVGANGSTGVNWANRRSFITALGDSWYLCCMIARKTSAATSSEAYVMAASADGTSSYVGSGAGALALWDAGCAASSVPVRPAGNTLAQPTGQSQTGGAIYVKGLPASSSGLLLPEDIVEINGELKTCTAPLNSDAAGLGYLQFEPPLVRSPSDNDPVIITDPTGKFLVSNLKIDNEFGTQARVSYDLEHIYE